MKTYMQYLHSLTATPPPVLAIVPKQAADTADDERADIQAAIIRLSLIKRTFIPNDLKDTKVHLWNDYATGKKPTSGTWTVVSHYIEHKNGIDYEFVMVSYPFSNSFLLRLRSTVCTQTEFAAWVAGLNADNVEAKAAA